MLYANKDTLQKWKFINLFSLIFLHIFCIYASTFIFSAKIQTIIFHILYIYVSGFGVTAGAHRYWSHKSYEATLIFRIILAFCYSLATLSPLFNWVRDHRIHHIYSDTNTDPHNASRGFWYSHIGWLTMTKTNDTIKSGKKIYLDDIKNDKVVQYQSKFYKLYTILIFIMQIYIPIYFWGENLKISFMMSIVRFVIVLNGVLSVNSFAHLYGYKPFNKNIYPSQNIFVSIVALGEGWHNYHHVFPYDYKTSEFGPYYINFTSMLLDFFNYYGLIYNLKYAKKEQIEKIIQEKGDVNYKL